MQRGQILLVDTNIIIEAVRTRCWNAITSHFTVETVEKCYEEALTGDLHRPGYVEVDAAQLRKGLRNRHTVSDHESMQLSLQLPSASSLDAGERQLFAHVLGRTDVWIVSCADRAAVHVALELGWEERIVTLELVARKSGARPALKRHFTEDWLSEVRTAWLLRQDLK